MKTDGVELEFSLVSVTNETGSKRAEAQAEKGHSEDETTNHLILISAVPRVCWGNFTGLRAINHDFHSKSGTQLNTEWV